MEFFGRIFLAILPVAAEAVLSVQDAMGVQHPTWAGNIARWVLRGDRRVNTQPAPNGDQKRVSDLAAGVVHGDQRTDPPT